CALSRLHSLRSSPDGCALSRLHSLRSSPDGCALSRLHSLRSSPDGCALSRLHSLRSSPDGCALSRLHSLRSSSRWLRAVALAFAPLIHCVTATLLFDFSFGREGLTMSGFGCPGRLSLLRK